MPGPFGRQRDRPARKAPSMTYNGTNGPELTDWARDDDLQLRFQDARLGQPARVLLDVEGTGQGKAWTPVDVGATIHQDELGYLLLEPAENPKEKA